MTYHSTKGELRSQFFTYKFWTQL